MITNWKGRPICNISLVLHVRVEELQNPRSHSTRKASKERQCTGLYRQVGV